MIPRLRATLQKLKADMRNPAPVPLEQMTEVMTCLSKYATNAKFQAALKNPLKKRAAQKKNSKSTKPKPAPSASASADHKDELSVNSEPDSDNSHPSDSEESEVETNITLKDIKVNDSIVWGANAGAGEILLCVGLVTKKKTRGASSAMVTYLLPVSAPTGRWLGEKLACNKYRKVELSSEEIKSQVFYKLVWEEADYSKWDFKLGQKSWSEITHLVEKLFGVKTSGITFSSSNSK